MDFFILYLLGPMYHESNHIKIKNLIFYKIMGLNTLQQSMCQIIFLSWVLNRQSPQWSIFKIHSVKILSLYLVKIKKNSNLTHSILKYEYLPFFRKDYESENFMTFIISKVVYIHRSRGKRTDLCFITKQTPG